MLSQSTAANTGEGQLLELAKTIADAEAALATPQNRVSITLNEEQGTVNINATLPASFTKAANGDLTVAVDEYII